MNDLFSNLYLQFLNLAQAIRELPDFPSLDPVEERLLNSFASLWFQGEQITVLQAMSMSSEISPTTVHRRLKSLRGKGMIVLVSDDSDNRIKYVQPGGRAENYFGLLGQCMEKARSR
ncbi:MAG: MarR family transcriptional regulator [Comamonadaceae bacterium]|jgi:DNA-binding MarR family transcriptional regulator|nr:MarR family transcriptional regulator [Comamonadaceae bacterium]